jgi:sugar phosphate isomerase/epimerase
MEKQMGNQIEFTVFTKPWPEKSIAALVQFVHKIGFNGIELPIRPGYPVTPENIQKDLPKAAKLFEKEGLRIASVAGPSEERIIAACGDAGIPVLRVMARIDHAIGYFQSITKIRKEWDILLPSLEKYGVKIGVQNHYGAFIGSAIGLSNAMESYDPRMIGIVLDPAHCKLAGEDEAIAIDIAWPRLVMVNLKNAFWIRAVGPENDNVEWKVYWTNGHQGLCSWPVLAGELKQRNYRGAICLTAEYSSLCQKDEKSGTDVDILIDADLRYARRLFAEQLEADETVP